MWLVGINNDGFLSVVASNLIFIMCSDYSCKVDLQIKAMWRDCR